MSLGPRLRVRARLRPRWDDDGDGCDCEPLWQQLLVALLPVAATGALELYIDRRKAQDREERKRRDAFERLTRKHEVE